MVSRAQTPRSAGPAHIADVMTRHPAFLSADQTVDQAARMMADLGVGALPVCENEELIGMLTDRDITVRCTATGKAPTECRVADAMSSDVQWCAEDDTIDTASHKMESRRIRRLPVIDREHHLVGMLSLGDLATKFRDAGKVLKKISSPSAPAR